ncbi:MAG: hypothetical protein Kow00129_06780 [Thermoleophilia bacterium]
MSERRNPSETGPESLGLDQVLGTLRANLMLILVFVVVGGVGAYFGSTLLPTKYTAEAELVYRSEGLPANVASDAWVIETRRVAERVAESMPGWTVEDLLEAVEAAGDNELEIIVVRSEAPSAAEAAQVANGFAEAFVELRTEERLEEVSQAREVIRSRLDALSEDELGSAYAQQLQTALEELLIMESLALSDYEILQEAVPPEVPSAPRPARNAAAGAAAAFLLGVGASFVRRYFNRRLTDELDIETELGLPVLATVPAMGKWKRNRANSAPVGFREGNEFMLEAFRIMRSNLQLKGFGKSFRSLLVTSAFPQEGKTTTAVNLALSLALSGERTLLVDADLRKPKIHRYLDLGNEKGLSTLLLGEAEWGDVIQPVQVPRFISSRVAPIRQVNVGEMFRYNLACLTSGPQIKNPAELLAGEDMRRILRELGNLVEYLIIDTTPVLVVGDSFSLLPEVDAVVVTTRLDTLTGNDAAALRRQLERSGANTAGVVVTGAPVPSAEYHQYYYFHERV